MNKTIISILFTQYAKYPNTKINANVTQLNENVQIKFGINANELIRNIGPCFISDYHLFFYVG